LRLLFVIKSLGPGGAERVLSILTAELAERGHQVDLASFDEPGWTDFYHFDSRIVRHRLGVGEVARSSSPIDLLRQAITLRRLLQRQSPEVAIGFMHSAFVPLGVAAVGTGIPVIASEHTAYDHYRSLGSQAALVRATAPLFAAFTATSNPVRAGFPRSIRDRMSVIANPVVFSGKGRKTSRSVGHVLLSVGVLRPEKRHDILIAAFARLADRFPDWTLRIVGDGPRRRELERQVEEAKLEGRVAFAGAVPDVAPEYAVGDLFAIPSSYESFGLATAEALAAGVPAVGFADCPGTNEIIHDGVNGLLMSGADRVEALAQGLATLMSDEERRAGLGSAGPASVAKYSVESVADQWEELLRSAASS